jgi:hypothetical protein
VNSPNRRTVTLAGLSLIGAGGVLGLALSLPGPAFADPSPSTPDPEHAACRYGDGTGYDGGPHGDGGAHRDGPGDGRAGT